MYYSSSLLKKFISVEDEVENIVNNLILKSCEIEDVVVRKFPKELVIGYTTKVEKHPEADKLLVCQVDCGEKGSFQILCGAKNVTEGLFVPVALPGAYLPAIDLKIEARKLRGLDSDGMICAKSELGIKEDEENPWIWILTEDFDDLSAEDKGIPLSQKYSRLESWVMDVDNKSLTHRPDLTGHFGMSTELLAIYQDESSFVDVSKGHINIAGDTTKKVSSANLQKYLKDFSHTNILETLDQSNSSTRKIISKSGALRSYILMEIFDVEIKRSSFYTRLELLDLGLTSKNNWVDFSNLFMSLTGQPVHFFDADKVDGDIIVRYAEDGEKFVDLFEAGHILKNTDLVVTDKNKILALAGVVGGLDSGVSDDTKNILVEFANFDPVVVRRTGTRLGLRTDAELRYEKNINPIFTLYSMLIFLDLVKFYQKDLGDYNIGGLDNFVNDEIKSVITNPKIIVVDTKAMMNVIFGSYVDGFVDEAVRILDGLGFGLVKSEEGKVNNFPSVGIDSSVPQNDAYDMLRVTVPMWRGPGDINIQEDIFEEVARVYGYNRIQAVPLMSAMENISYRDLVLIQRRFASFFVQDGHFDQMETYPWVEDSLLDLFDVDKSSLYSLQNPPTGAKYMRNSLRENLVSYVAKNSKFFDEIKVFDIGKVRKKNEQGKMKNEKFLDEKYASNFVSERMQTGAVIYRKNIANWKDDTLLDAKNIIQELLQDIELKDTVEFRSTDFPSYHPKKQADLYVGDVLLGFVGSLHPLINKGLKLPENASVTFFSLYNDAVVALLEKQSSKNYSFITLQDQIVSRDLCFVIDEDKDFSDVLDLVNAVENISNVEVFDLYKGENIPVGKKSIAFKFKIAGEGNMKTEDINKVMDTVIAKVEKSGAELRK